MANSSLTANLKNVIIVLEQVLNSPAFYFLLYLIGYISVPVYKRRWLPQSSVLCFSLPMLNMFSAFPKFTSGSRVLENVGQEMREIKVVF